MPEARSAATAIFRPAERHFGAGWVIGSTPRRTHAPEARSNRSRAMSRPPDGFRGPSCKLLKMRALRLPRSGHPAGRIGEEGPGPPPVARGRPLAQIAVERVVPELPRAARAGAARRAVLAHRTDGCASAE